MTKLIKPFVPKTHLVIPARYKSSRLEGKPLLPIHGKAMILWVAEKAKQADFVDDRWIATDDERIANLCQAHGFEVVMTRSDHASGTDRLAEVAQIKAWQDDDIVINMQGDEPLVPPKLLLQVKSLLEADPKAVMATLYEPIETYAEFMRPSVVKVVTNAKKRALYFSRSPIPCDRDLLLKSDFVKTSDHPPKNAFRHLGLYAYRVKLLKQFSQWPMGHLEKLESLEQLRILENGKTIAIDLADARLPAGVDTAEDLQRLNAMPFEEFITY